MELSEEDSSVSSSWDLFEEENLLEPILIETKKVSNLERLFCSLIKPLKNVNFFSKFLSHLHWSLLRNKLFKLNFYLLEKIPQHTNCRKQEHRRFTLLLTVGWKKFLSKTSKNMLKASFASSFLLSSLNERVFSQTYFLHKMQQIAFSKCLSI